MGVIDVLASADFSLDQYICKLLHDFDRAKVELFSLEAGQEVGPQVTNSEVLIYVVEGEGTFIVGDEEPEVRAGSMVVCAANEPHGVRAKERMVVLVITAPKT